MARKSKILGPVPLGPRTRSGQRAWDKQIGATLREHIERGMGDEPVDLWPGVSKELGLVEQAPGLRRMTWEQWRRDVSGWDEYPDVSKDKRRLQKKLRLEAWARPERMHDYPQYGWTRQPLVAFANEVTRFPGTPYYASYTRPAQYSDYAVIGGVAFAVGMKGNDMTLDYLDNKTGKVRKGRAVYHTQSAVMKRVSRVAGKGQANIEQAPGLRPRARCDISCKTCVHYLAKGHTGKGYCQLYDFMTYKKWVCDSWKGQGVYAKGD